MIFKKEVHFPYPVLSPFNTDYVDCSFELEDVVIQDLGSTYRFVIEYDLDSNFVKGLLKSNLANIYLIVDSKDIKYYEINETSIDINKNRISLHKKTHLQLFVSCNRRISMADNFDLDPFYDTLKEGLYLRDGNVLAISNIIKFDGDTHKAFDLFERDFDENLDSEIEINLGHSLIKLIFRDKKFEYYDFSSHKASLNYPYIYMGLQKALMMLIIDNSVEDSILIEDLPDDLSSLYDKLVTLIKSNNIDEISFENIDFVIDNITDHMIYRNNSTVRRLIERED